MVFFFAYTNLDFIEEFVVYVLFSEKFSKTYIGFTSNLIERFKSHNQLATKGYTLKFRPWKVIHVEFFDSKSEAMKREKYLKTGIGREFIKNLINSI
ncbi:GIY-YIG nuclease family protein [Flavobacterium anhuiense]|uniref:GIY-YIG nuclease family protein n=1 Tax=Flavobacterium anhuiense TaxID=459526 RepID=UPI003D985577